MRYTKRISALASWKKKHGFISLHRSDSDPHVRDCIKSYTADYTAVSRNYERYSAAPPSGGAGNYSQGERESREGTPRISHRQEYEVDVVEEPQPQSDRVSISGNLWWEKSELLFGGVREWRNTPIV